MEERDLSFQPVINPNPKRLSAAQIEFYNQHGYLMPFRIFDDAQILHNRQYFDWLLQELFKQKDGRDHYAINGYQARCRGIYEMLMNPLILDYVEEIIGPNIVAWATHFFCKMPHDPKSVPWHQDASYWQLTPARTVTVWIAIDDADPENAAMQFLPGTHKLGHLSWQETKQSAVLNQEIVDVGRFDPPVYAVLKAGEISLHADMLAHGSAPNYSERRRCGLTIRYCPPEVRALNPGWMKQSFLCRGVDVNGNWTNNPPPPGEDLSPLNKPKSIGGN